MANGLPGVETRLATVFSTYVAGMGLPVTRFLELLSADPARANGLYPRKGALLPRLGRRHRAVGPRGPVDDAFPGPAHGDRLTPYGGM